MTRTRLLTIVSILFSVSSCQLIWELNPLEGLDNPILPASGEMDNWSIEEFRGKMASTRWTTAVINDTTLGSELVSNLQAYQTGSTEVEASLLLINAYTKVEGVPDAVDRVITDLFPQLINSGLLNGFTPATDSAAMHSLMVSLVGNGTDEQRLQILQVMTAIHQVCDTHLGSSGANWFASATLEEMGPVAQVAVGAAFIYAATANTASAPFTFSEVITFLDSDGSALAFSTNFDIAAPGIAEAFQAVFNGFDKSATAAVPYEHLDPIGDVLPF